MDQFAISVHEMSARQWQRCARTATRLWRRDLDSVQKRPFWLNQRAARDTRSGRERRLCNVRVQFESRGLSAIGMRR